MNHPFKWSTANNNLTNTWMRYSDIIFSHYPNSKLLCTHHHEIFNASDYNADKGIWYDWYANILYFQTHHVYLIKKRKININQIRIRSSIYQHHMQWLFIVRPVFRWCPASQWGLLKPWNFHCFDWASRYSN